MKAKKTIRRMTPLARKLAKLQREIHSIETRMSSIIAEVNQSERQLAIYKHIDAEAATTCRESEHDNPADPPDSTGKNGPEIAAPESKADKRKREEYELFKRGGL